MTLYSLANLSASSLFTYYTENFLKIALLIYMYILQTGQFCNTVTIFRLAMSHTLTICQY